MKNVRIKIAALAALSAMAWTGLVLPVTPVTQAETVSVSAPPRMLRVMSYNVHHCNPPSKAGIIDLDAVARVIKSQSPDLVALQEIDVHTGRSGAYDQAEELGKKTGLTPYFIKAIDYDGGQYGVAILSRFPMTQKGRFPLPTQPGTGGEPRVLGTATVTLPDGQQLLFACTHLDAQRDDVNRELQMQEIVRVLGQSTLPVILAGDLNAEPGSSPIRTLDARFTRSCGECPPTIPVEQPRKAIDFVAFAPKDQFTVAQHQVVPEKYASDHLPVVVQLKY